MREALVGRIGKQIVDKGPARLGADKRDHRACIQNVIHTEPL